MIVELLEKKEDFTDSEVKIADYILQNPFSIANLTASELGDITYTSKSSVFRLCNKLGYNYNEFKIEIDKEFKEKDRLNSLLEKEPFQKTTTIRNVTQILPSLYDTAINNTNMLLDYQALSRIVMHLNHADKIDIYSSGITATCAETAQFKFQSIGRECSVFSSMNEHYAMSVKDKNIIAFALSFTGNNSGVLTSARYLKKLGFYVVGIGGLESNALKNECDEYIETYQKNLITNFEMMSPFISMTYIFDLLFVSIATKDYDKNLENSIAVREMT